MAKRYFDYASKGSGSSRTPYDPDKSYNERRFESENKKASEKLRKTIQSLSVEDQINRRNEIHDIDRGNQFQPREFASKRKYAQITSEYQYDIDLNSIPLPKNDKNWRENSRLVINKNLLSGSAADRLQKWKDNIRSFKSQK